MISYPYKQKLSFHLDLRAFRVHLSDQLSKLESFQITTKWLILLRKLTILRMSADAFLIQQNLKLLNKISIYVLLKYFFILVADGKINFAIENYSVPFYY